MKIVTVGSKAFVTSFQLAVVPGVISDTSEKALDEIKKLISDDISEPINDQLTSLRTEKSTLVFALPSAGSKKVDVDYRAMLKKILGV